MVPCGESLKTYGRINFGFGHISLVSVDKSDLLITSRCFAEADFICVDFGVGTDGGNYALAGKKEMPIVTL